MRKRTRTARVVRGMETRPRSKSLTQKFCCYVSQLGGLKNGAELLMKAGKQRRNVDPG